MNNKKYTIGYLDEEELWQAQASAKLSSNYNVEIIEVPIPISEIWNQVVDRNLDALIVDYRLFGSGVVAYDGNAVVAEIMKHNEHFPMFIITSYEDDAIKKGDNVLIIKNKDIFTDDNLFEKFSGQLDAIIRVYNEKVKQAKDTIFQINGKQNNGEALSNDEKEKVFKAELFLSEIDKDNSLPSHMFSVGQSQQLQEMIELTQELLGKL